jgi:PIN domain nuclease of toxin-antitoxin system
MRLLLDTHGMYWYIEGDPQLSATARTYVQEFSRGAQIR